jgi:Flp pilus assembly protein TadG
MRRNRKERGVVVMELAASAFMLLIFSILAAHLSLMVYGAYINDRACRDAARAAAQGSSQPEAEKMANVILTTHHALGSYVEAPSVKGHVQYQDYNGSPPAGHSPFVHVVTETKVHSPFKLLTVCGETFQDGAVVFTQSYTFPVVRVK